MNKTSIYRKESDIAAARLRLSCRRQPKRLCVAFRRKAERMFYRYSCRLGRATAKPNRYNIVVGLPCGILLRTSNQPTKLNLLHRYIHIRAIIHVSAAISFLPTPVVFHLGRLLLCLVIVGGFADVLDIV